MTPRDLFIAIPYNWTLIEHPTHAGGIWMWRTKRHVIGASIIDIDGLTWCISISRNDGGPVGAEEEKILTEMRRDDVPWSVLRSNMLSGLVPSLKMLAHPTKRP